jgi:hypothetical protein
VRADMSHVIVERPRRGAGWDRRGRDLATDDLPAHDGMRRPHVVSGRWKALNENLAPLLRFLEKQVGRPWDLVYSEIAANLRADNTVQQHVRDHLDDFVAVKPRRGIRRGFLASARGGLWHQALYVDPADGILKRTDRLPEEKARRREERVLEKPPVDRVRLKPELELRRIEGLWYAIRFAKMPEPIYREVNETRKVPLKLSHPNGPRVGIDVMVRRLAGPAVKDIITGEAVPVGPAIDEPEAWKEFDKAHPGRMYPTEKRRLSKKVLRRYGLTDRP